MTYAHIRLLPREALLRAVIFDCPAYAEPIVME